MYKHPVLNTLPLEVIAICNPENLLNLLKILLVGVSIGGEKA